MLGNHQAKTTAYNHDEVDDLYKHLGVPPAGASKKNSMIGPGPVSRGNSVSAMGAGGFNKNSILPDRPSLCDPNSINTRAGPFGRNQQQASFIGSLIP